MNKMINKMLRDMVESNGAAEVIDFMNGLVDETQKMVESDTPKEPTLAAWLEKMGSEHSSEPMVHKAHEFRILPNIEEGSIGPTIVPNDTFVGAAVDTAHYDVFELKLTPEQIVAGNVRVDPYQVASSWNLGEKDSSGCLFHMLKTIARFGAKKGNDVTREIASLEATLKRLKELQHKAFIKK